MIADDIRVCSSLSGDKSVGLSHEGVSVRSSDVSSRPIKVAYCRRTCTRFVSRPGRSKFYGLGG